MKLAVIKRMAKGSVQPLFWVLLFFTLVVGTTNLIAYLTDSIAHEIYFYVLSAYSIGVLLYWSYNFTKWNMELEQQRIERELARKAKDYNV